MGTVKSITVSPDLASVLVTIETVREAEPFLNDKTIFWVVKPELFAGNITGLDTLLVRFLHRHAAVEREGRNAPSFHRRSRIRRSCRPGQKARPSSCRRKRLGSISLGSPIFFRDLEVGTVLGWDLGDLASNVTIHAFVRAPYDKYVHDDTSFWNASGLSVKLADGGIAVQMESLRALLLGGIAFDTPSDSTQPVAAGRPPVPALRQSRAGEVGGLRPPAPARVIFPGLRRRPGSRRRRDLARAEDRRGDRRRPGLSIRSSDRIVVPVHYRDRGRPHRQYRGGPGPRPGHARRGDGQARAARHPAVAEPDHRRQDRCPGTHCPMRRRPS